MKPMLAVAADLDKIKYPIYAQPKLDGIRCVVKDGQLLSRSLKPIRNQHCQDLFNHLEGYDGELIVGHPCAEDVFQKSTSGVMSSKGEPDVTFYIFDRWDLSTTPYTQRQNSLDLAYNLDTSRIISVHSEFITDRRELDSYLDFCIERGFEGVILRDPDSLYKYGYSTVKQAYLLKIKLFEDDEFEVTGFTELMHNGNEATKNALGATERSSHKENLVPSGMLGSLIVRYKDTSFEVGTGFTHAQRKEIFENQSTYLGKLAKVRYQKSGMKDLPRFPSFQGFRDADDLS